MEKEIKVGGYVLTSASLTSLLVYFLPDMDQQLVAVITPFIMAGVNLALIVGKRILTKYDLI